MIEITENHLKEYEEHVKTLFSLKSKTCFSNGKKEHAGIIIVEFLERAEENVFILCKDLLDEVYSDRSITAALYGALLRGVDVSIIVQNTPLADGFLKAAGKYTLDPSVSGTIRIRKSRDNFVTELPYNFAVMDMSAYRFEEDNLLPKAVASANGARLAEDLYWHFKDVWDATDLEDIDLRNLVAHDANLVVSSV